MEVSSSSQQIPSPALPTQNAADGRVYLHLAARQGPDNNNYGVLYITLDGI